MRVASVFFASLFAASMAQAPQRPTFRATTNLIQVDVVVVDAAGHPVRGLTKDDFQIFDRGRPQAVAAIDEVSHEPPPESPLPPTLKLDVADNSTARSDRLVVLVIDDLHFQGKTPQVKDMARRVVESLGPQASLALVTTSGQFGVEPTEDRAQILDRINAFTDKYDPEGRLLVEPKPSTAPASLKRGDPASFYADMAQYKVLGDVAKKIGADDGRRKAFVWISGGNSLATEESKGPVNALGSEALRMTADDFALMGVAGLLESLRQSNVSAYSIDTGDFSPRLLNKVAGASGGFVIDAKSFDRDVARLIDDLDHYYLLGFYPDAPDKSYHPLEVRVTRPGLTVRYRQGYDAGGPPPPPKNKTELSKMSGNVLPATDLPLGLFATPLPSAPSGKARVEIALEVRGARAPLTDADQIIRDVLRYEVWAVDLAKKKSVGSSAHESHIALGPRDVGGITADPVTYQVQTSLMLAPGRYQLRASATSAKLGKGGSVYLEIEVPDFKQQGLALSGIVLGYSTGVSFIGGVAVEDVTTAPTDAANSTSSLPFKPDLDRDFSRADTLRLTCDLSKPARAAADVRVDVVDMSGQVSAIDARHIEAGADPRVQVTISLRNFVPGGYLLRVTAADGTKTTTREVGIVVR